MAETLEIMGMRIRLVEIHKDSYICLTDMAAKVGKQMQSRPKDIVNNWMRTRSTFEFMGAWEALHNSDFNGVEYNSIRVDAGTIGFTMTAEKWRTQLNGMCVESRKGRYGGTYGHPDVAFEFASTLSPKFKLLLIKEYQHLKEKENPAWDVNRFLSKRSYHIQSEAIQSHLLPEAFEIGDAKPWVTYANEADLLNTVLFGQTAREWKESNQQLAQKGNMRDYATPEELIVLDHLQSINAHLIRIGVSQERRYRHLKMIVAYEMPILKSLAAEKGNQLLE